MAILIHHIDDSLLLAMTPKECKKNIKATVEISDNAGFVIHPEKSVLVPTQMIKYLGFWLDFKNMTEIDRRKNAKN